MARSRVVVHILLIAFCLAAVPSAGAGEWNPAPVSRSQGQTIYVPVYSHIYSGDRERPFYLAVTMSIRNTDPEHSITISKVDYYDSDGKLIREYVEKPVRLAPMASIRYVVGESDKVGGSGANFLITWSSGTPVNAPLMESVMISTRTQQGISFVSRGQVIEEKAQ